MSHFTINKFIFLVPTVICEKEFKKIDNFMKLLEKSEVWKIIENVNKNKEKCKGRKGYNSYNMLAMVIYCFAFFKASLRDIEDKCIFDIRTIYIMEGNIPKHTAIGDFINNYIVPYQYEIFTTINKQIIKELNINIDDNYDDGTKMEANANKYKFVWKPTKYHLKLDLKIKELITVMNYECDFQKLVKSNELYQILNDYADKNNININNLLSGKGVRIKQEVKNYKLGYNYLNKLLEYEEKEEICGDNRNSYYKTDKDATVMVLKEDYYSKLSNDFHAGYNVQVIVSSLLILMYGVFQERNDYHTFIPMNDLYFKYYEKYPKNECDDSGYGIYKNYKYIREHDIGNYIKFQSWKGETSGKNPQLFFTFDDGIMCLNTCVGKDITLISSRHPKNENGRIYKFTGCNNCKFSYKCKKKLKDKNLDYRIVELIPDYELLKEEARVNLQSPKGIELRINRSIQVEGTFGQIKNNMNYDRFRRRGLERVSAEIMLECLGVNIRRYFNSLDGDIKFKNNCWDTPNILQKEKFPYVKPKEKKLSRN